MAEELGRFDNCPVCGKQFYMQWPGGWVYRATVKGKSSPVVVCSYTCIRKAQSAIKSRRSVKRGG